MRESVFAEGVIDLGRRMRKVSRVRVSKGKRLEERVRELEGRLEDSVPKTELETVRSNLQSKITELQRKLSESVPKATLDATKKDLQTKIISLEAKLRESVSRSSSSACNLASLLQFYVCVVCLSTMWRPIMMLVQYSAPQTPHFTFLKPPLAVHW